MSVKCDENRWENRKNKYKKFESDKKLRTYIAEKLNEGKVVGWFHGHIEFGSRALGNRSILANPTFPDMKDKINRVIKKREGFFPDMPELLQQYKGKADAVIIYSVIHYVFYHNDLFRFLDEAVSLLNSGGKLIIGDIPNSDKRKRFFETEAGIRFHQEYTGTKTLPDIKAMQTEPSIDDAVLFGILQRYRNMGYETYISEQSSLLPMSNRREDIVICKW
mgnify:CR=1 FL=1